MKAHERDQAIKTYIIESIDYSDWDDCSTHDMTTRQKIVALHDDFMATYGNHNINRENKSKQTVMADWLMGLPSGINIAFMNHEIIELLKAWGVLDEKSSEKKTDDALANYWNVIAAKILQIYRGYRVPQLDSEKV